MSGSPLLFEFRTAKPGNPLFCHVDFLERIAEYANQAVGKRVSLLLQRMLVDESRLFYKTTQGVNRGWRRSRLGGAGGNHHYLWWTTAASPVIKGNAGFADAPEGAIFVRDIRHHDDHSELPPHDFQDKYLPLSVADLRSTDLLPSPYTSEQQRFTRAHSRVRVIKGYPGSGKTTALWHATEQATAHRALYVTFSADLAALARDHFDKYAPVEKHFHVTTFSSLFRAIIGETADLPHPRTSRERTVKAIAGLPQRTAGVWAQERDACYDEIFGHLIGAALPIPVGRFPGQTEQLLNGRTYRELRSPIVGRAAADALCESVALLRRREGAMLSDLFTPELALAWRAAARLISGAPPVTSGLTSFDCIAIDEAQDLTPIETLALTELARNQERGVTFLAAGDEAQTVRPTDFEWGWFSDILNERLTSPADFKLTSNLRSPRTIAELVNSSNDLYLSVRKCDRPSGQSTVSIDNDAPEHVLYCSARSGPELDSLFSTLTAREGLAVIAISRDIPAYVPAEFRAQVFTATEAKGLDFNSVCLLGAGSFLRWLKAHEHVEDDLITLNKRVAIDRFRVGLSRPSERLIWLDVDARPDEIDAALGFIGHFSPVLIPDALLQSLEEDQLDVEERIRRCMADALQLVEVKPGLAWARANQAITLAHTTTQSTTSLIREARRVHFRVGMTLALSSSPLPPEFGAVNLQAEAHASAALGYSSDFAMLASIIVQSYTDRAMSTTGNWTPWEARQLGGGILTCEEQIEPWLVLLMETQSRNWIGVLEHDVEQTEHALAAAYFLPVVHRVFSYPDAEDRIARLRQTAARTLIAAGRFQDGLTVLGMLPAPAPLLEAQCYEGLGQARRAAEIYLEAGESRKALAAYRSVPDSKKALELARKIGDTKAIETLEWLEKLNRVLSNQPDNLMRNLTAAEKDALGRTTAEWLPTPAARKARTAVKAADRAAVGKPAVKKRAPPKRKLPF